MGDSASRWWHRPYCVLTCWISCFRRLGAEEIDSWIATAKESGIAELESFADGLTRDLAAVHAGVTLECSSGQVEGQNNRIKLLKRQTYGRAGLPFLRKRVTCG